MKTQITRFVCLLFLFGFGSCSQTPDMAAQSTSTRLPIYTATQHITPTFVETLPIIATPVPVQPTYVKITPHETQIANWKEYETALANKIMFYEVSKGDEIICEWEILGQNDNEVYVWAICTTILPLHGIFNDLYPSSETPAVIQLNNEGQVLDVKKTGPDSMYGVDVQALFPEYVQEKIFNMQNNLEILRRLSDRLEYRRDHPNEVPLFVLDATPTFVETLPIIATPVPVQPTYIKITPDEAQIANWKEYETALANRLLSYETSRGHEVICEWELIGQAETELYVWAKCSRITPLENSEIYPRSENPAVIQLNNQGIVVDVKIPGPDGMYGVDVKELFPEYVQEKIFNMQNNLENLRRLSDRLEYRRDHPNEFPLFVLDATPTFVETLPIIATPVPVQPTYIKITPDEAQIANWKEYETALANRLLSYETSRGREVICEWELLGQDETELYVWTICSNTVPIGNNGIYPISETPAVIQLNNKGIVVDIKIPGPDSMYGVDVQALFPESVQKKIFNIHNNLENLRRLSDRLEYRRDHPDEVPLFVLDATPTFVETLPIIATPVPVQPAYVKITPDEAQIANWKEYETALANEIMFYEVSKGNEIICEWELLGQNEKELYIWTICSTFAPLISDAGEDFYPTSSIPALIQLDDNGNVVEVKIPGNYARDIRKLFPEDVQEIIFHHQRLDIKSLQEHLQTRRKDPDHPPLIVEAVTNMP